MMRRLPIIPTMVVVAAVALLIGLGIWQLKRADLHQVELAQFKHSARLPPVVFPTAPTPDVKQLYYRSATGNCLRVVGRRSSVGENRSEEPGFAVIADCATGAEGPGMSVQLGWSKNPNAAFDWKGGLVSGVIVPDDKTRLRLVAAEPAPGLEASAAPQPSVAVSPARNRGYAATWFSFAAIALLIYALAVRKRLQQEPKA